MPGLFRTIAVIFRIHLFRVLKSRRMLIVFLLSAIPAIPVFLALQLHSSTRLLWVLTENTWLLHLQVIVPLVSLIAGSGVVAEEIADRTASYVFTRPVPRAGFLIGRWLAMQVAIGAALGLAVFLLFAAASSASGSTPDGIFGSILAATLLGGTVYLAVFTALSAWFKHPMIVGLGYVFAIEGLFARLPGKSMELAIQYHLRAFLVGFGGVAWEGPALRDQVNETPEEALITLTIVFVAAMIIGCWQIGRRQLP